MCKITESYSEFSHNFKQMNTFLHHKLSEVALDDLLAWKG